MCHGCLSCHWHDCAVSGFKHVGYVQGVATIRIIFPHPTPLKLAISLSEPGSERKVLSTKET